jgi:5'-nucleotidase
MTTNERRTTVKRFTLAALLLALLLAVAAPVASARPEAGRPFVSIQLVNVSDWHAQLDPLNGIGGAPALSTYFKQERASNPNTLVLTAGDAYGASPPLSGFFNEEPAVKAMNLMGFDADTFGNHNFDRGLAHLQQMIDLAEFPYVVSNLLNTEGNLEGLAKFKVFDVGGIKVGLVGLVNPEAPTLVFPGNFGTLVFDDTLRAAAKARAAAKREGARVFVLFGHFGVTSFDASGNASGPLIDLANTVSGFDVILGDHTDIQYSGIHNDQLVVENKSKGVTYARTTLVVDPKTGTVQQRGVQFVTPTAAAVAPDQAIVDMLAPYRVALAAQLDGVIGVAAGLFPRNGTLERVQEAAVGNLTTDAMRLRYGTQLAFTNGGGLRSPLPSSYLPQDTTLRRTTPGYAAGPPYDLVIGDVFSLLPFGNSVVTRMVTGGQLWQMLEHSVAVIPGVNGRFGQISGFKFTYDAARPPGGRVVSVQLNDGTQIAADTTLYSFATNDFTNTGGDGYTMLADGQGVTREVMADVVLDYIRTQALITPTVEGRITRLN